MEKVAAQNEEIRQVPLHAVKVNPHQPRKIFDLESLTELGKSIETVGLIHPLTVRPLEEGFYELIAGERRYRACQMIGIKAVPVYVKMALPELSAQAALIENVQRVDLNPLEIAKALQRLIDEFHSSQEYLAQKIGKKRSTIANYLRLLSLPPLIQRALAEETISMGHAKAILSLDNAASQEKLYRRIIDYRLSVREAEQAASKKSFLSPPKNPSSPQRREIHLSPIEDKLRDLLGTKVTITGSSRQGQVRIDYYSLDDLHDLIEKLGI